MKGQDFGKVLTLTRSGDIEVRWQTHKGQCGYYGNPRLTYHVTVRGAMLDCPQGWLMDNNDVPHYFETVYAKVREYRSCEMVASMAVDHFRRKCAEYKARPSYIRVAVSGIPGSEIVCEWTRPTHGVSH